MVQTRGTPRLPENHRLVYDVVREQEAGTHATTRDIFAAVARRRPGIGYSTVYRALDRLCTLGLIARVRVPGGTSAVYEPARTNHAHFLCTDCGRVDDVDYVLAPADLLTMATAHDVEIRETMLTLRGTCARCRAMTRR